MRRTLTLSAAMALALASTGLVAQEARLPDIGSSAGELLTEAQQERYGAMMLAQLRNMELVLEDPLVDEWLAGLGGRLAASSDRPKQAFTFFMLRDRQINAFATLGGYVAVNSGLVLAAEREDEVAAVLSHEIAHVTQEHVLRSVERAQRDQLPLLLAMLGAIALSQHGGSSSGDAAQAAMVSAMGLAQQRQIDYSQASETEADRIGIQTLARSQYDPEAMADFFATLQARSRANQADAYGDSPYWLMTHPVTLTRISEARERAKRQAPRPAPIGGRYASDNPLLPTGLAVEPGIGGINGERFAFARERLRVLSAETPAAAIAEYERLRQARPLDDAQRYGLAVAELRADQATAAATSLASLLATHPGDRWIALALAEAEVRTGHPAAADARLEALLAQAPRSRPVALTYARLLAERNTAAAGKRAQAVLRPLLGASGDDPLFQKTFARASEIAGDPVRAGEAYAEAAYLSGRAEQALVQLTTLKKREDLDYYGRARIESRIAAITPVVLELRRQGIRDEDLHR